MELGINMAELQILSENFMNKHAHKLPNNEYKVLVLLKAYGECSPKILINKIGILKSNLASVLKKLIKQNYVAQRQSEKDARVKMYSLTQSGDELISKILLNARRDIGEVVTEDFFYAIKIVLSIYNKKL